MDANAAKRRLGFDGKDLRTPNILELFIVYVLVLVAFYILGIINSRTSGDQQFLLLIVAAVSSAVIGTLAKTYLMRDNLKFF